MNDSNSNIEKRAKALFDESVEQLDAATLSQLNRRRHAALAALHDRRARWMRWAPAAGVTAALAVAVMLALPQTQVGSSLPVSDMDILLSEDSIEMLEDLDFYAWLDMQEEDIG